MFVVDLIILIFFMIVRIFMIIVKLILRHRCNLISHVRLTFFLSIFFAFIYFFSIFVSHSLHYMIVYSFTLWRWAVIRNFEFQKRIFDTIQRVFEFSSRRKFHTRSIEIVRSCFRWRRDKRLSKSIHRANSIINNNTICCVFFSFTIHLKKFENIYSVAFSFVFFVFFVFYIIITRFVNTITSFLFFRTTISFHFFLESFIVSLRSCRVTFSSLFCQHLQSSSFCFEFCVVIQHCHNNQKKMFIVCYTSHVSDDFKLSIRLSWEFSFASEFAFWVYNHEIIHSIVQHFVHHTIRIRDFLSEKCLFTVLIVTSINRFRFIKILMFYLHIYTLCDVQILSRFFQSK